MASAPKCRTLWGLGVPMAWWQVRALMSALFAALTAIFAKLGVEQINPDAATLIRSTGAFLVLTGLATGACSWCYVRALHIRWRPARAATRCIISWLEPLGGVVRPGGCFRGLPVRPCDPPRPQAPDAERSCASRRGHSAHLCARRPPRAPDSARSCASRRERSARPCARPLPPVADSARSCASRPVPPCHPCSLSAAAAPCSSMRTHGAICALHELFLEPSLLSLYARSPRDAGPATLIATCEAVLWSIPLAAGADKG